MNRITGEEFQDQLGELGIRRGDIVHVQSDLARVGIPYGCRSRGEILAFYLTQLQDLVGEAGTISVSTAFEDFGYFGEPFVRESSPSRTDAFSEYVRRQSGAVRSEHPIVSVTALGKDATYLCGGRHFDGFGYRSPWARLHEKNAKILTLGLDRFSGGTTFFHYVERLFGQPYVYTKLLLGQVYSQGELVTGPFTMSVRYLDYGIVNSPIKVKSSMVARGVAFEGPVGNSRTWCASAQDVVEHMCDLFEVDRWAMLEEPPAFRLGEVPFDGPTKLSAG